MTIYICGPTGLPERNYPAFSKAALTLEHHGYSVLSPVDIDDGGKQQAWDWYMRATIKMLLRADSVALLPGWSSSKGANLEWEIAKALVLDIRELKEWL